MDESWGKNCTATGKCHKAKPSAIETVVRAFSPLKCALMYLIIYCHGLPSYMSSVAVCFPRLLWIVRNTLVTNECDPGTLPWKSYLGYLG